LAEIFILLWNLYAVVFSRPY